MGALSHRVHATTLTLAAQVILLRNLDQSSGLVSGSRGVVVDFRKLRKEDYEDRVAAKESVEEMLPRVRFDVAGGSQTITVKREVFSIKQGGVEVATRNQVPLRCAWALSMHKSQGMTIDKLEVSLEGIFEAGQAYVALSRATSLDTLRVTNFPPRVVRADPRVVRFYDRLAQASRAQRAAHDKREASKSKSVSPAPRAAAGAAAAAPKPKRPAAPVVPPRPAHTSYAAASARKRLRVIEPPPPSADLDGLLAGLTADDFA